MCAKKVTETPRDVGTTGHQWDGIEELNNPLPRWWVWVFYLTIIWGIGYTVAYPAWPLVSRATQGLVGWTARSAVEADLAAWDQAQGAMRASLVAADVKAIPADPALKAYAVDAGRAVFNTYCVQCHQREGQGVQAKGYPTLSDNDWLYGGDMEAIVTTIAHGVRNATDAEARSAGLYMPAWSEAAPAGPMKDMASAAFSQEQLGQVVHHVLRLSGQEADPAKAAAGAPLYAENCAGCHGAAGEGSRDLGAPNLADAIWLFGGDEAALTASIAWGRGGVMPAWLGRLDEAEVRAVATYVHTLGGGE